MSASKAYKPAHGGYPSAEPLYRKGWKVVYCDQFGLPESGSNTAYADADTFGADSEGVFSEYPSAVDYLRCRRDRDSLPGVYFTIVEVRQ